jgi:hypothetical protein
LTLRTARPHSHASAHRPVHLNNRRALRGGKANPGNRSWRTTSWFDSRARSRIECPCHMSMVPGLHWAPAAPTTRRAPAAGPFSIPRRQSAPTLPTRM